MFTHNYAYFVMFIDVTRSIDGLGELRTVITGRVKEEVV